MSQASTRSNFPTSKKNMKTIDSSNIRSFLGKQLSTFDLRSDETLKSKMVDYSDQFNEVLSGINKDSE